LSVEPLECRWLPSAAPLVVQPNETIDLARDLGTLNQPATALGSIGGGPAGAADVTWYHFQLADAARVDLKVSTPAGDPPFASVLSLYNNDPNDCGDPYDLNGHRLLDQVQASPGGGTAECVQDLGPGDYFVAVSGAGNTAFSPVIAGSGYYGATGDYELTVSAADLGFSGNGPTVLSSDPAAGSVLDSSPLAIRVEMSGPIDPNTIVSGQTVQLLATTGNGAMIPVALAPANFSAAADELQLFPLAPLAPGTYVVQLAGNSSGGQAVLASPAGVPLGEDAQHPAGADESFTFQVAGIDGVAGATASDDTAATARNLGDITGVGIVHVAGAIGDDPAFNPGLSADPSNPDPQFNPANQVDLYHFQIVGPGQYAMLAEVFAGRIGSTLNPGISLFELDPSDGQLVFVAGNQGTLNRTQGTDGSYPLLTDPALIAGLTAGDYYLAVADGLNTPLPIESQKPGSPGILDPNQPGSAQNGWSTGPYLLNLMVQPAPDPPQVVASSPSPGQVLGQAPTQISVKFSEPVDIQQLAFYAYEVTYAATLPQVFVEGADGTVYYARFLNYNRTTNTATFQMLDGLPNGSYALHLSGPRGLTDLGGNPLPGNDPSGDYVIPFAVQGPDRGIAGDMANGYWMISQAGRGAPQDIGVLFPDELQAGVAILRYPTSDTNPGSSSTQDEYVIQVLQHQRYSFQLIGDDLPVGTQVTLTDASGQSIPLLSSFDGGLFFGNLQAGTYTVSVGGWASGESASISYQLLIELFGQQDNAPPLVDGPAPLLQISFASSGPVPGLIPPGSGSIDDGAVSGPTPSGGGPIDDGSVSGPLPSGGGPGTVGSTGGNPGGAGSTGGGSGTVGSTGGESGSAYPGAAPALNLVQNEAVVGLSGLGMSPLGGVAGQTGATASPAIQVALSAPSGGAPVFDRFALSLVTLTSMIPTNRDGEGIEPVAAPRATEAVVDDQPESLPSANPAGGQPGPAAYEPVPNGQVRGSDAGNGLIPAAEPPGMTVDPTAIGLVRVSAYEAGVPEHGKTIAGPPPPGGEAAAAVEREETGPRTGMWVARWAIVAATVVAVYRARTVIRNLDWRKRPCVGGARPGGPIAPQVPHADTVIAHPASGATTVHAMRLRSRRRVQAASSRP
jgi:methionine-rich copper-binding protein CopC